jgi:hypothetical protein
VAADAEISEDAIDRGGVMKTQEAGQVTEIMRQEGDAIIRWQVTAGVAVLVEGIEPAFGAESLEDSPGMSPAAEGTVDVSAFGANIQSVKYFLQQDRQVISVLAAVERLDHD